MDVDLIVKISMPIVTLFLGILINRFIENREKLIVHLGYIASHKLAPKEDGRDPTTVNTHSVILRNSGNKAAKNVRVGHNYLPDFNVYPDIEYSVNELPAGGKELLFPTLTPKKEITISYLYFPPNTWEGINTHIESDEGKAKVVQVLLQAQPKPIVLKVIWFFIIVGLVGTIYSVIELIKWFAI
ncbi:hypothetical protein [Candidatus Colwellia aromaticivorans]|uniref:hypothetical protein n=1 Tax=Candidatus Colwellia aromaticivorans TaxID=2267621 RepID=UPI000DF158B6|nr:hypothetical protein [Candidatus Colwellia aromaticivorans]